MTDASILDSRTWDQLRPFYPSACSIYRTDPNAKPTPFGEPGGVPAVVPGCEAIPCRIQRAVSKETRTPGQEVGIGVYVVGLLGYFPVITRTDVVRIDAVDYNVLIADSDSFAFQTQLTVELVTH